MGRKGHLSAKASPPHPPLEEIELWVPNPHAKFGPPKRKRTEGGERRGLSKKRRVTTEIENFSGQESSPLPSSPRPPILPMSQIIALREEEEESQSQPLDSKLTSDQSGRPAPSSIEPSSSVNEPSRSRNGTLAERRAFEARLRLVELRRAGAGFGSLAKGRAGALNPSQSSERPPPHVIFKQVMDGMKSPTQSQITFSRTSGDERLVGASSGERRRVDLRDDSEEDLIIQNQSGQDTNGGSLPPGNVHNDELSSEDEVPASVSGSYRSHSHDASPHVSLGGQLAAALDLLHRKSEEISELRATVNMLRGRTADGKAKSVHMRASNRAPHNGEEPHYLATGVQTDRDDEALVALNSERAQWTGEKRTLQDEAEALRNEKALALADVDFFREQYQRASAFASTTRSENEELSARAALAESQATKGVALVRATLEVRVTKLEAEVRKYKALSEMLTERARRTGDDVRYRASLAFELEREFKQLHRRFEETEEELEDTKDKLRVKKRTNTRLRRRLASLERKEQADLTKSPVQELALWSDEKDDTDYSPGESPLLSSGSGSGRLSPQQQGQGPLNEGEPKPSDREVGQLAPISLDEDAQPSNDDIVYLCLWRPGNPSGHCDAVLSSKEKLLEHVASRHLSCH
ncbi:hypothetical protein F5148DRAFT_1378785 [Russula earlei]|uniref:Uncharacterized protein n=1 Tax=Russula earlei TaxID=71964 RepID=A0ACC0TWH3_9AGAM|nr:hypothetical protein F5148DRAFT_1378785 [Russula earlei]